MPINQTLLTTPHSFNYLYFAKSKSEEHEQDTFWKRLKVAKPWLLPRGQIFTIYLVIILLGGFLLSIPGVVHQTTTIPNGKTGVSVILGWKFLLGLFNASSAFSDTGLSIASASTDYSFWGQLIIAILIELGGFGVLTFKIMLWVLIGRKLKIKDLILVKDERGGSDLGSTVKLIKLSFGFLLIVQLIAAAILTGAFYFSSLNNLDNINNYYKPYHNFARSLWAGIFHSISAINNAGFDIIGKASLHPYNAMYLIQFVILFEFIIGGIGFPTFYDLSQKKFGFDKTKRLTVFTKLNLITYGALSIVGVGLVAAIEYGNRGNSQILAQSHGGFNGFMAILFNTMSTRNAGFSTFNTSLFLPGSKIVHSIMMFIGSAPSSTAGGIRTTTLAVLIIAAYCTIRNKNTYNVFKRSISHATVRLASSVLFVSSALVGVVTMVICGFHPNLAPINVFYTTCSAFGTVGLNNLTQWQMYNVGTFSTLLLICLMFIGQLGVSGTLLSWTSKKQNPKFTYSEEQVRIG